MSYLGTSESTLRRHIKDPIEPMPHTTYRGHLRFHISDLNSYLWFKKPFKKLTRSQKEELKERKEYE